MAYENTNVTVQKSMGDIAAMVIARNGQFRHTEAPQGFIVEISVPTGNGRANLYEFKQIIGVDYIREHRRKRPRIRKTDEELIAQERRRRARVLFYYLKNLYEAIDTGLIETGAALLGFLKVPGCDVTLYEAIGERIESGELAGDSLMQLALPSAPEIDS